MAQQWFEDWFNSPYYEILYKHRDEQEAEAFIDRLLGHLQPKAKATILDLASGKGRFSRHLAKKGFEVTGLDLSENSVRYARQFERDNLSFFQHDMRQPFRTNYYDFIFNFFTSFGYFDHESEHVKTLDGVAKGLRRDGTFVLDFFNSHFVRTQLLGEEKKQLEGITFHIHKWVADDFVYKSIRFSHEGQDFVFQEKVRLFTLADFQRLFQAGHLQIVEIFGDYQLAPFSKNESPRLILVGKRYDSTATT
jgi:SAM-dependent methyltransferase